MLKIKMGNKISILLRDKIQNLFAPEIQNWFALKQLLFWGKPHYNNLGKTKYHYEPCEREFTRLIFCIMANLVEIEKRA